MLLLLLMLLQEVFFCEEKRWPKKKPNFSSFCSVKHFFDFTPTKNFHIIRKRKRWRILRWTTRSIPRTKTAQCQWQRYVSLLVLVLLNTTITELFVGGTRVVACVFLSWWDMKWKISSFSFFPPKWQQKDFSSLLNTTRALLFVSSKHCTLLRSWCLLDFSLFQCLAVLFRCIIWRRVSAQMYFLLTY